MSDEPTAAAALLASPVRRRLVEALGQGSGGGRSAAQLADLVGLHVTTVRFHLDQLAAAGVVGSSVERREGAGRPRKVYALAPGGGREPRAEVESLRLLSGLLVEALAGGGGPDRLTPAEAGRRWALEHVPVAGADDRPADTAGRWLGKLAQMVDVLEQWGYTPEVATSEGGRVADITLSHCPFLDLARENSEVVCGIHRGLIAGSLERLGENATRVTLEPFAGPTTCVAHVSTTAPFRGTATTTTPVATTTTPTTTTATKEPA
jgi:predicted ArsR family transcriptional regulator